MNWQPIETAPKDGDVWLAYDGRVARGFWAEQEFREIRDSDGRYVDQVDEFAAWLLCDTAEEVEPTHWMEIVPPPPPSL